MERAYSGAGEKCKEEVASQRSYYKLISTSHFLISL